MIERKTTSIKLNMILGLIREFMTFCFPLIINIYIVRALGKETYGLVQYIRSNVSYFALLAGLGISTYAIREGARVRDERRLIEDFSAKMLTINSISTGIALLLLTLAIIIIKDTDTKFDLLLYIVFAMPIIATTIGRDWINIVYEDYIYITIRYIVISIVSLLLIITLVKSQSDYLLFAILSVLPTCLYGIINLAYTRKYAKLQLSSVESCKEHIKPIMILFSSAIASTIYLNSDITILGALINTDAVAIYSVAANTYGAIKQISNSVVAVVIPRLSYYAGTGKDKSSIELVDRLIDCVIAILLPCVVGLFELREQALLIMGGPGYLEGSVALSILSLALLFAVFANVFVRCVLIPHKLDGIFLKATIASAIVNIVLNFIFVPLMSYNGAALTTLISEIIILAIAVIAAVKVQKIKINLKTVLISGAGCIPIVIICEIFKQAITSVVLVAALSVVTSAVLYFTILFVFKHPFAISLHQTVARLIGRIKQ